EDAYHVGAGIAAVDDERQSGLASSRDMRAQGALLRLARTVVVMIIEPHLADPNHLGMPRALDKIARRNIELLVRVMRMGPDRAEHLLESLGDRQHLAVPAHPGRDRYNFHQARGVRPGDDGVELGSKIRKIEMAMAVDQYRHCSPMFAFIRHCRS